MMIVFPSFLMIVAIIILGTLFLHTVVVEARINNVFSSLKPFLKRKQQQSQQQLTFPYSSFSTSTTSSTTSCCTNNIVGGHLALKKKRRKPKQQQQQPEDNLGGMMIETEAAELARLFDQVLVSNEANNDNDDVHVGRLLLACEQLAHANRNAGFTQSAYDILGNIKKVRNVYDAYPIESQRDSISALIEYELTNGIHKDPTKYFTKNSAAMGFLWLARNINYQYDMFSQMILVQKEPYDAAISAYERALKPHLSRPLQRVGHAALGTLKPIKKETIISRIGGFDDDTTIIDNNNNNSEDSFGLLQQHDQQQDATIRDMKLVLQKWQPMLSKCQKVFHDLDLHEQKI